VNWSADEAGEVPLGWSRWCRLSCRTGGETAVIERAEVTVNEVAGVDPKHHRPEVPRNPVPVMVTVVPPACAPTLGLTALTVGPPRS